MRVSTAPDVAVVGAGPTGCVTALAFAHQGARVVLLEASPQAARRLAGEWLHPAGVAILRRLGVETLPFAADHAVGHGFVVFPHDASAPIVLDYADGSAGLSCEHYRLVSTLREAAAAHPAVCFVPHARVTQVEQQRLTVAD